MASELGVQTIQHTNGTDALTIDSSGRVGLSNPVAFRAHYNTGAWQSFGNTSANVMPFDTTTFNIGSHYDTTNYKFVAPVDGIYHFYFQWYGDGPSTNAGYIQVNGTTMAFTEIRDQGETVNMSLLYELSADDEVQVLGKVSGTDATDWYSSSSYSYFEGYLIG